MKKICKYCGREFETTDKGRKYCSENCFKLRRNIKVKVCKRCGKPLENIQLTYCSDECKYPAKNCEMCGELFQPSGYKRKLCPKCIHLGVKQANINKHGECFTHCVVCGEQLTGARTKYCCKDHERQYEKQKRKEKDYRLDDTVYTCLNCGKEYHPKAKDRNKFCSKKCAGKYRTKNSKDYYCKSCGKCLGKEADALKNFSSKVYCSEECHYKLERVCNVCGKTFEGSATACICSDECRKELARQKEKERSRQQFEQLNKIAICRNCGKEFQPEYGSKLRSFCPDCDSTKFFKKQRRKKFQHLKNYKIRGGQGKYEKFTAIEIYERDGWICQLCGKKVLKDRVVPHPKAPTLDHIIPIVDGGAHIRKNVQLAHFECNCKRGNREPAQLRLIA
jgi:hypothetical protein